MKKIVFRICGIAVGVALLAAYIATGTYWLSEQDKDLYYDALALQETADEIGFDDFKLEDYPVAFYDGKNEYVITSDGNIEKREPVLDVFVATAFPVDEQWAVFVPTYKRFEPLTVMIMAEKALGADSEEIRKAIYISTIWHEAMHAWQSTNYDDNINAWDIQPDFENTIVDNTPEARALYEQELTLLYQAAYETDMEQLKAIAEAICTIEEKIEDILPANAYATAVQTELTEGSAQYFESRIFRYLRGEEDYIDHYVEGIDVYNEGRAKYYTLGMAKCLLIDKLDPAWKNNFAFDRSFADMIRDALKDPKQSA